MVLAARLSRELGHLNDDDVARITRLLERAHLPVTPPDLGPERYLELMGHDKKVENGRVKFILLEEIGKAFVSEAPRGPLTRILEHAGVHA
jgi:3-dehydroquinate synthase